MTLYLYYLKIKILEKTLSIPNPLMRVHANTSLLRDLRKNVLIKLKLLMVFVRNIPAQFKQKKHKKYITSKNQNKQKS